MNKKVVVNYCGARCGDGKTEYLVRKIGRTPGLHVLAVDRRDVMDDRERRIRDAAMEVGLTPLIRQIGSPRLGSDDGAVSVKREFRQAANQFREFGHVVLIVTHEAVKGADLSGFSGWSIDIDEVPSILDMEECQTTASWRFFDGCYSLAPLDGSTRFSRILAKTGAPSVADYATDQNMREWVTFHRRVVSRQGVVCDLRDWAEMSIPGATWRWWSIWSPDELAAFDSISVVGNAFRDSMTAKMIGHNFPEVSLEEFKVASRVWQPRNVTIRYFADRHVSGSYFWFGNKQLRDAGGVPAGAECLPAWIEWVRANTEPTNHFWTSNLRKEIATDRIPCWISPKVSGVNDWRAFTTCSMLYTSKVEPNLLPVYQELGLTPQDVTGSREYEDLKQFVMRTSLRVPDDTRPVVINLYDLQQAEEVKRYLETIYPFSVKLVYQDIGINHINQPKPGPKPVVRTEEEQAAYLAKVRQSDAKRAQERRDEEKAEKIAAGTYRGRGRPRKAS